MKIQTSDGKIFDVPEQNLDAFLTDYESANAQKTGMTPETQQTFEQTNQDLRDLGVAINRGNNTGGALRNLAMGVIPGTAEAEAALRATKQYIRNIDPTVSQEKKTDTSWSEEYDKYLENARASREGYMASNPNRALSLQITGGLMPALLTFGASAPATGATLGARALRSSATGAGIGAAFGFGNSQGGLENRLMDSLAGAGWGGGLGLVSPYGTRAVGGLSKGISRTARGLGKELPQSQIEGFVLSDTLKPTTESRSLASTLSFASSSGAKDIENVAYQLSNMHDAMQGMNIPSAYAGKTAGGTTAKDLLKATEHPSMSAAKKDFGDFVASVPTIENPTRPVQAMLEKLDNNKSAISALTKNEDLFRIQGTNGEVTVLNPGNFEYWQKAQQILNNQLPKKFNPSRLTGPKKEIYDAIQEIKKVREKLFPGTKTLNAEYASAVQDQRVLDKQVSERLKMMSAQQKPESVSGGVVRMIEALTAPSYNRGLAREIIKKGQWVPSVTPTGYKSGSSVTDSILRALENFAK